MTHDLLLEGCTPEPLMAYLKALGVLRLVGEQKDPRARGRWRDGFFELRAELDHEGLVRFFLEEYRPSPIVVPWSGSDFFGVDVESAARPVRKTPTSTRIIEAFLATTSDRFADYRATIRQVLACMREAGAVTKADVEDKEIKARLLATIRSRVNPSAVDWVDACAVLSDEKASFSAALGSGGGSDGNTHFSDNFMQNLWEMLPDFATQNARWNPAKSAALLADALFSARTRELVAKRTSTLYDAAAVGGPNAGQGFDRVSLGNPWSIILCLEGAIQLGGTVTRRYDVWGNSRPAFPFQVRLSATAGTSAADKEEGGRELWLPLWPGWTSRAELRQLFSEGRASVGARRAERGVDVARAVASLGVERGIDSFGRFAIVKGRVGGDNYNTSASLGRFPVRARSDIDLLREIDPWLERFRLAASDEKKSPPRFRAALRGIESAIFDLCQYGGPARFAALLCALGRAERALASGERFREAKRLRPLACLSDAWAVASDDGSVEHGIALGLSTLFDPERRIGPLRANLEPVTIGRDREGQSFARWAEKERAVAWTSAELADNLAHVLERRLLDARRKGGGGLPLGFVEPVPLEAVARFLAGETDDTRIAELLWGLCLVDVRQPVARRDRTFEAPPLPAVYALLKLLYLPFALREAEPRPDPAILPLLRSGRTAAACGLALTRLRAAGLVPLGSRRGLPLDPERWTTTDVDPLRLAAALLFPISKHDAGRLAGLAVRPSAGEREAVA